MPYPVAAVRNKGFGNPDYIELVKSLSPLAFWPLNEAEGSVACDQSGNGYNGTYTGVTLGQPGQGGQTCPLFDGANDFMTPYSAGLNTALSRTEYTFATWVKPYNAGVWTDGAVRQVARILTASAQDGFYIGRTVTNGVFVFFSFLGATSKSVTLTTQSWATWTHIALTVSDTADEMKAYLNGAQAGTTQTGLGTNSGNALNSATCHIGSANATPFQVWNGWMQYAGLWTRALSAAEVASLAAI